tara:strand:- start:394 stop:531 length:138 start_codon:yes stop_codon:yes gene_type:complete
VDLSDKKAAKRIIKRFKKHPEFYTKEEVMYAKLIKRMLKKKKKEE